MSLHSSASRLLVYRAQQPHRHVNFPTAEILNQQRKRSKAHPQTERWCSQVGVDAWCLQGAHKVKVYGVWLGGWVAGARCSVYISVTCRFFECRFIETRVRKAFSLLVLRGMGCRVCICRRCICSFAFIRALREGLAISPLLSVADVLSLPPSALSAHPHPDLGGIGKISQI